MATAADTTAARQASSSTTERAITPNENLSSKELTSTERSVELPTPVEDHFKSGSEEKSAVMHDEQPAATSRGDKIKAFTKKLKFWSRTMDKPSDDGTANEADDTLSHSDETIPKSVDDEIEAILSAPKKTKQTAKQSSKKPSMEVSDKVTPADINSHKDQSLTDKKQERETTSKQKTAFQGGAMATLDNGMVEQSTARELKELKKNNSRQNDSSRQSVPADKPAAPPMKQKPTIAVKPKPSSKPQPSPTHTPMKPQPAAKPQAHIAPIQKDQPLTVELLFKQLEQKVAENDYYQLLGLEESASAEEIARRRRERSRELHPDHYMTDAAQKAK